jgi:hypothetical protein
VRFRCGLASILHAVCCEVYEIMFGRGGNRYSIQGVLYFYLVGLLQVCGYWVRDWARKWTSKEFKQKSFNIIIDINQLKVHRYPCR